jgi:hypothetical protein
VRNKVKLSAGTACAEQTRSDRVIKIYEAVVDSELHSQVFTQCVDTISLSRVVAGREIMDAGFAGNVYRAFGYLSADVCIASNGNGFLDVALCGSGAPCEPFDSLRSTRDV